jgi:hypothetical protein
MPGTFDLLRIWARVFANVLARLISFTLGGLGFPI